MAMIYTLVTSAKEWLSENFGHEVAVEDSEETDTTKDDVWLFVLAMIQLFSDNMFLTLRSAFGLCCQVFFYNCCLCMHRFFILTIGSVF